MKIGVVAPLFSDDAKRAVSFGQQGESMGFDGVLVFDHLYPLGQPNRHALAWLPILSAIGASTSTVALGPLVARVGVTPNVLAIQQFHTLHQLFGDRLIAAIGIGDHLAKQEYEDYGVPYKSFEDRLADGRIICESLHDRGMKTWVSAKSSAVQDHLDDVLDGINLWESTLDEFTALRESQEKKTLSWAGVWGETASAESLLAFANAGCDWAIVSFAHDAEVGLTELAEVLSAAHAN